MTGTSLIGPRHPGVQRLRRLSQRRRARTEEQAYVIDGPTLLDEALGAGVPVDEVVAEAGAPEDLLARARAAGAVVHTAREGTLARVTDTVHPQPVAAVARLVDPGLDAALDGLGSRALVLVLVGVNDPGNAGTLLRSADAAGADLVVLAGNAVDPYNPKCVRAAAGALFRARVVREAGAADALDGLRQRGIRCLGTVARGGTDYDRADLAGAVAVVLGSESHGLPAGLDARLDERVTIPMRGPAESLNVAMAGTVVCFEALRQRRGREAREPNRLDATTWPDAGCSAA
jgi:RNA methyltransferase, TrmH family